MPRKNEFVDTADALRPCLSVEPIYACTKATYGVGIDEISKCARVNQPDVRHKSCQREMGFMAGKRHLHER